MQWANKVALQAGRQHCSLSFRRHDTVYCVYIVTCMHGRAQCATVLATLMPRMPLLGKGSSRQSALPASANSPQLILAAASH